MDTGRSECWKKTLLQTDACIKDACLSLSESTLRIVMVVDHDGVLQGIVSDGDIRRGILSGLSLNDSIKNILNSNPVVFSSVCDNFGIEEVAKKSQIYQLPIVNHLSQPVGLKILDHEINMPSMPNLMVIMAGGLGMRLRPYTESCPKPMLLVNNKPILEHIIEKAKGSGLRRFCISINYLGSQIIDYFGDGEKFGVCISYIEEEQPGGTAGSLANLKDQEKKSIIVSNGDIIADVNYYGLIDFHEKSSSDVTIVTRTHGLTIPYGVIEVEGSKVKDMQEKPQMNFCINSGIYAIKPSLISKIGSERPLDMPEWIMGMNNNGSNVHVYPTNGLWADIGTEIDLKNANK